VSALSDELHRANRENWAARRISREAQLRGHTLSHETVAKYLRGDHAQPEEATLVAFADALSTSLARLREAAGIVTDEHGPFELPAEAARLTKRQREAVVGVVRAMLEPTVTTPVPETPPSAKGSFGSVKDSTTGGARRRKAT
jgi:hypothetical protein